MARHPVFLGCGINDSTVFSIFAATFIHSGLRHNAIKILLKGQFEFRLTAIIFDYFRDRLGISKGNVECCVRNALACGFFFEFNKPFVKSFSGKFWKFLISLCKGWCMCCHHGNDGGSGKQFPEFHLSLIQICISFQSRILLVRGTIHRFGRSSNKRLIQPIHAKHDPMI